jgi:ketosteroid isomerase-like protein
VSAERVDLARTGWDLWRSRDFDALDEVTIEDFVFVPAIAASVEGGAVHGNEGSRRFFAALDETWESFEIDAEEFREVGDQVLVVGRVRAKGRGSGLELDQPIAMVVWFLGEKIARIQSFLDADQAHEAASKELEELQ